MKRGIADKYDSEISEINYMLNRLKEGNIYDPKNGKRNKGDGYLETNIEKVEDKFHDLLYKIDYNKDSISDQISQALGRNNI